MEQRPDMTTISPERLAAIFVEIADTLVDEFDLIDFLQTVTRHTSSLVEARAVGFLLADQHERLQVMAASDERAELLELFQVQAHEGPCLDCFRLGHPVVEADLRTAGGKWPQFAPRAVAAGFRSVHAFPLRLRGEVLGALNLFGNDEGTMAPPDVKIVQSLADVATIALLQERAVRHGEVLTEQLQKALNSRVVIEQAKGALAQLLGVTPDEAFELLRTYCRRGHHRLGQVAADIVGDPRSHPNLTSRPARA
jgi:GAF domain-containing protein